MFIAVKNDIIVKIDKMKYFDRVCINETFDVKNRLI